MAGNTSDKTTLKTFLEKKMLSEKLQLQLPEQPPPKNHDGAGHSPGRSVVQTF